LIALRKLVVFRNHDDKIIPMTRTSLATVNCSLAQALEVVGDKWAMMIVRDAFYGVRTFSAFQRRLGIARNILTDRLKILVDGNVLEKVAQRRDGERMEYRLTQQGRELFPVLVSLMQWGDKWILGPGLEPVRVLDAVNLAPVPVIAVSSREGRFLEAGDVRFAPGPGADDETRSQFERAAKT
jgi:DNA-binding HxlR family transcriptional regulator